MPLTVTKEKQMKYYMNDETDCGIVISDLKNNFIMGRSRGPRVFNNLEVAKVMSNILIKPKMELKYYIQVNHEGKILRKPISDCQYREDHYEFFASPNKEEKPELFEVYEKDTRKCIHVGYIFFDDAETARIDREEGKVYQFKLMNLIKEAAETIFKYSGNIGSFDKLKKGLTIKIKNSTTEIHVLHVSKLMDVNQARKKRNFVCFPFIKEVDKFRSFYVVIDKDVAESTKTESASTAISIINTLVEMLNDDGITCYYKNMDDKNSYPCPVERSDYEWQPESLSNPQN